MTRIFTDAGEHLPVTVLKVESCQVVAHRTLDKNGYVAVQLGAGKRKPKNTNKAERGQFARAEVEPKRKLAEFRVDADALIPVAPRSRLTTSLWASMWTSPAPRSVRVFCRRHEAAQLRRSARLARRVDLPPLHRFDRWSPGSGQDLQEQEDARHMGDVTVTTQNLKVVMTDVERGLIAVEGAVPGHAGGWIMVRDAVKKRLPSEAPKPGAFKLRETAGAVAARSHQRGGRVMELTVKTLDGAEAGSIQLSDAIFGLEPRAGHPAPHGDVAARPSPGRHAPHQGRSEINRTQEAYKQKGTGNARHGAASAPQFRGGGRAFGPVVRSHAFDLPKKVRALALKHALSSKAKAEQIIVLDAATLYGRQDQGSEGAFREARHRFGAGGGRRAGGDQFRSCGPQPRFRGRAACAGHQRVRHSAARHPGSDPGRRGRAGARFK